MRVLNGLFFVLLSFVFVGCGSNNAGTTQAVVTLDSGEVVEVLPLDTINAIVVEKKLGDAGIEFTMGDDMAKRLSLFSTKNQSAIKALTKFKFGNSSVQMSVVEISDVARHPFVSNDLLASFNEIAINSSDYVRGVTVSLEDADTALLMIYNPEDFELADQIIAALK